MYKNRVNYVAVCIPNFNMSETISKTIESVLNQTYFNIDIIISDNCSTDDSWEIIKDYSNKYKNIKIYRNNVTTSFEYTFNTLLDYAIDYEYVNILAADDTLEESFIEECIKVFYKDKSLGYVYTHRNDIIDGKKITSEPFYKDSAIIQSLEQFSIDIKGYGKTIGQVLLNNEAIKSVNRFDVRFRSFTEVHTILKLNLKFKVGYVNKPLFNYTKSNNGETAALVRNTLAVSFIYLAKYDVITSFLTKETIVKYHRFESYLNFFMIKYTIQFIPQMILNNEYDLAKRYLFLAVSYNIVFYDTKLFNYLLESINTNSIVDIRKIKELRDEFFIYERGFDGPPYALPPNSIILKD